MKRSMIRAARNAALLISAALVICLMSPAGAAARDLGVEVWTDRGSDAVYQPGDVLQIRARATDDTYLLVYEIDSEGYVRVLFPVRGHTGLVSAKETYVLPPSDSDEQLVVQDPTGQDFIVAIASRDPFDNLPWYLRPYDPQGDEVGYVNAPKSDDDGVTSDGRIVGDPFVAMERIRRRALPRPTDANSFATAYTSYFVHEAVRYPRYICNDCHRPDHWAWWDGWDPYYTHCSVVDFRINWSWNWGPTYWTGFVPYYVYVPRLDCPPAYRWNDNVWYSSWDGWSRWTRTWNGPLTRYKSPPPPGYIPPALWQDWHRGGGTPPPGIVTVGTRHDRADGVLGRDRPTDGPRTQRVNEGAQGRIRQGPNTPPHDGDPGTVTRQSREYRPMTSGPRQPTNGRMPARPSGESEPQRVPQHREPASAPPPRQAPHQQAPTRQAPPHESSPPHQQTPRSGGSSGQSHSDSSGRQSRGG
jgi:hypothetical protein